MAKSRSPEYPAIGLLEAIERVAAVYEGGVYRSPITKQSFAEHLGYKSLSGASLPVLSALSKYGLIEGRGDDTRISELAVEIITHPRGSPERAKAIWAAASKPELFAELDRRYDGGKTTDQAIRSHLLTRGFIPSAADAAIRAYRETKELAEAEPVEHNANASWQGKPADDTPLIEVGDLIQVEIGGALQLPRPARVRAVQEHQGHRWVFIDGSESGIPVEQAILESKERVDPPRLPLDNDRRGSPKGWHEERLLDEDGEEILISYRGQPSIERYNFVRDYLDFKMSRLSTRNSFIAGDRLFETRAIAARGAWIIRTYEGETAISPTLHISESIVGSENIGRVVREAILSEQKRITGMANVIPRCQPKELV